MARNATVADCIEILRKRPQELSQLLPVEDVQLSFPVGKGPRIKVSVRPGERKRVPENVRMRIHGEDVSVSLEIAEDFQDYQLH